MQSKLIIGVLLGAATICGALQGCTGTPIEETAAIGKKQQAASSPPCASASSPLPGSDPAKLSTPCPKQPAPTRVSADAETLERQARYLRAKEAFLAKSGKLAQAERERLLRELKDRIIRKGEYR